MGSLMGSSRILGFYSWVLTQGFFQTLLQAHVLGLLLQTHFFTHSASRFLRCQASWLTRFATRPLLHVCCSGFAALAWTKSRVLTSSAADIFATAYYTHSASDLQLRSTRNLIQTCFFGAVATDPQPQTDSTRSAASHSFRRVASALRLQPSSSVLLIPLGG